MKKNNFKEHFLIETHSEHLILRFLKRIRETYDDEINKNDYNLLLDDIAVYYVSSEDNITYVTHLKINQEGDFIEKWPEGFFEESK